MATLHAGGQLNVNDKLSSDNGAYQLLMQADGNLVLYAGIPAPGNAAWDTQTWNLPPAVRPTHADMQADGNFVLYTSAGQAVWNTQTSGYPGARLDLQNDRNLVIYDTGNTPIWASHTDIPPQPHSSSTAPAATTFNGKLHLAYIANNPSNTLLTISSADGVNWGVETVVSGHSSKAAPTLTVFNGRLHLAYIANNPSNTLLTISSADGVNWGTETVVST